MSAVEYSKDRSERAKQLNAEGRFGGKQPGAGRKKVGVPYGSDLVSILSELVDGDKDLLRALRKVGDGMQDEAPGGFFGSDHMRKEMIRLIAVVLDDCVRRGTLPPKVSHVRGKRTIPFWKDSRTGKAREREYDQDGELVKSNYRLLELDSKDFRATSEGEILCLIMLLEKATPASSPYWSAIEKAHAIIMAPIQSVTLEILKGEGVI